LQTAILETPKTQRSRLLNFGNFGV